MNHGILILNKHPQIVNRCLDSIKEFESDPGPIIVICDNHHGEGITHDVGKIAVFGKFVFSKNVNIGLMAMGERDVFFMNDDVTLVENESVRTCAAEAGLHPNVGMMAPMIDGGIGNPYQDFNRVSELWPAGKWHLDLTGRKSTDLPICFVAVFLKRKMLKEVGPMDENFTGYGFDDNDYCLRARRKGWRTTITRLTHVKHGAGGAEFRKGENWNCTYHGERPESNLGIFTAKYGGKETS